MYGSKLTKIGRNSVPEFRPRKVNCGFSGVCSYLLDIICIMVSELMILSVRKNIEDIFCGSWQCVTLCINMPN